MCERQNTSIWPSWYGVQDDVSVGEPSGSLPPAPAYSHVDVPPPYEAVSDDLKPPPYSEYSPREEVTDSQAIHIPENYDACSISDAPPPYTLSSLTEAQQQDIAVPPSSQTAASSRFTRGMYLGKCRCQLSTARRNTITAVKFSQYTNVVVFGIPQMMPQLEDKLLSELQITAKVIACHFPFPTWAPEHMTGEGIYTVWVKFSQYTNVVVFGIPQMMPQLEDKLLSELQITAKVIACHFPFPTWAPEHMTGEGIYTVWERDCYYFGTNLWIKTE
ncbi:UNVERIFIED_CONTAM: hypothetical protein FKN15_004246 [Acipenser sinensis]